MLSTTHTELSFELGVDWWLVSILADAGRVDREQAALQNREGLRWGLCFDMNQFDVLEWRHHSVLMLFFVMLLCDDHCRAIPAMYGVTVRPMCPRFADSDR